MVSAAGRFSQRSLSAFVSEVHPGLRRDPAVRPATPMRRQHRRASGAYEITQCMRTWRSVLARSDHIEIGDA